MSLSDDYKLLELATTANEAQAKASYRRLAKLYHPDKNPNIDTTETFQNLQVAYQNVLGAIRQGIIVKDWQAYDFNTPKYNTKTQNTANDDLQHAYVKERQRAYDELKRNSQKHEQARKNAIRDAHSTINKKRVKKMYEEAFKASQASEAFKQYTQTTDIHSSADHQVDEFIRQYQPDPQYNNSHSSDAPLNSAERTFLGIHNSALTSALRALTYLIFFALGVYGTLYWQSVYPEKTDDNEDVIDYISGLYPQLRQGINYTLTSTPLYLSPDRQAPSDILVPEGVDVIASQLTASDWVAIRYQDTAGWVEAKTLGFGSIEHAQVTGCYGYPGPAPLHGDVFGEHTGNSRLRILNSLPSQSLLTFESYDGHPSFSIFLHAGQSFAANFIPRGEYRLVLQTGSLYHRACNQFLFNKKSKVFMDGTQFASTSVSLTLSQSFSQ
ncbi:J domain-containing protein [Marinomonas sp. 2405UD68-3]|uniref:J domain-containing protein n=1 Tax=Marinomonas sp. 2405UD68-3 TaxID=3391835 RepID=UPI0039C9A758